ncbi:hypothetical protein [Microcoleus asticus]|uniref:Uncharacterized protein n=1 Tax=Microcoleus asticus IPMA8 TaxID=2563858 RepID=A0ABX2D8C0_9CYAN|nr:hypothetical protein [Microcoleus asticus]NQE38222.1 hypothetical protein [Microcoleus asticus IPMA8]
MLERLELELELEDDRALLLPPLLLAKALPVNILPFTTTASR